MFNFRKLLTDYEKSARSSTELLPWMCMVSPSMVLNKDGSLLVCYAFEGMDAEGIERFQIDSMVNQIEASMRVFNNRITIWSTIDRRLTDDYPEGDFEHFVSKAIDMKWRESISAYKQYRNRYYISIMYRQATGTDSFFEQIEVGIQHGNPMMKSIAKAVKNALSFRKFYEYEREALISSVNAFEDMLGSFEQTIVDLGLRRLETEGLLTFLHNRANPASEGQNVKVPNIPIFLDAYLPDNVIVDDGNRLRFEHNKKRYVAALSVKDWPSSTEPGLLDALLAIPGEITVSQCFRLSDKKTSEKYMMDIERHNRNLEKSMFGVIKESLTNEPSRQVNHGRQILAADANHALTELTADSRVFGYYNITICTYGDSVKEVEETTSHVNEVIQNRDFLSVRETQNLLKAWGGTLTGQWAEIVRWFFVSGGNVADLFPARTLSIGNLINQPLSDVMGETLPAMTVLKTEYNTPYYFSFHQSDLAHTIVVGPSRTGKSLFLNFLVSQFRKYRPCKVFIFDKDYSCRIPTVLQGGTHLDLAGEMGTKVKLNPIVLIENKEHWPFIQRWLEILISYRGYQVTSDDEQEIWKTIALVHGYEDPQWWKLSSFIGLLPKHLGDTLAAWVGEGSKATYFDNEEDSFALSDFTCVEMKSLLTDPAAAAAFLEYAFYRINMSLDGSPTLIEIEEAWFLLAEERFTRRLDDWLRTLAKRNAMVLMATQSLIEISKSSIFEVLIDNIPNRIFLPNDQAFVHEEMYRTKFSLNTAQIERIQKAQRKRDYYIVTPRMSRMVQTSFDQEMVGMLTSQIHAQHIFTPIAEKGGEGWEEEYINSYLDHMKSAQASIGA